MLTLAIDTSGLTGSIALLDGQTCLVEQTLELGRQHGQALVAEVARICQEQNRRPADVQLVAVSRGPGSFTGLRVGVVFAKTLAYAARCPAVGVDTFLAIAENTPSEIAALQIVEDAQRGELFIGRFRRQSGECWKNSESIAIASADSWINGLQTSDTVTGPALARIADRLAGRCRILPEVCWRPRANLVGHLGQRLLSGGAPHDLWSLEPLYLRRSSAEDKWESRQAASKSTL